MNAGGIPADPQSRALLAARLFSLAPQALGGLCLRGTGPVRDLIVESVRQSWPTSPPWRRLPVHIDDGRLSGGIDVPASLAAGRPISQPGILTEVAGGILQVPMAERMSDGLAGKLAQAIDLYRDGATGFGLLLLDDGLEPDERPPDSLSERVAFLCDLSQADRLPAEPAPQPEAIPLGSVAEPGDQALTTLALVATKLGVASLRALLFARSTAMAHAALAGRSEVEPADLDVAAALVLAPRATRLPSDEPAEDTTAPPDATAGDEDQARDADREPTASELFEQVLQATLAAIPPDVMAQIAATRVRRGAGGGSAGRQTRSLRRGRPMGARPGLPRDGARLALIDTLRAAVPWQQLRRSEWSGAAERRMLVRKDDLRIRRFEERVGVVTIFCVDASGSAAVARLAEAKGAVELILAQAYVTRCEVSLIAFRGMGAELLLPPTRSLTRARRALASLPGGGGTPLAAGLALAHRVAGMVAARGSTPFLVLLTDGSANITAAGQPGRTEARADAIAAANVLAGQRVDALVIDISPRPRADAEQIAHALRARYLPLPMADARAIQRVVSAAQPDAVPA